MCLFVDHRPVVISSTATAPGKAKHNLGWVGEAAERASSWFCRKVICCARLFWRLFQMGLISRYAIGIYFEIFTLVAGWIFDPLSDPLNLNSQGMLLDLSHQQDFELLLFSHLEGIGTGDPLTLHMHCKSQGESIFR